MVQAGYTPPPVSCRAAIWQFWKQNKPIYGSAAVIDWDSNEKANQEVQGGYWESVTNEQSQSVACLVSFLLEHYSLSMNDIKVHEELCAKTKGEGKTVYDAILPLLKK